MKKALKQIARFKDKTCVRITVKDLSWEKTADSKGNSC